MNRAERRKRMKEDPAYKKAVKNAARGRGIKAAYDHAIKNAAERSVEDLEQMFRKKWEEDDETLNNGEIYGRPNYGEDDILNS